MGDEKTGLLMDHVTQECFQKTSLYATIYAHSTRLYAAVSRGLSEAMQKMAKAGNQTSAATLFTILGHAHTLIRSHNIYDEISKMKQSAATFLTNANKIFQDALSEHESKTSTKVSSSKKFNLVLMKKFNLFVIKKFNLFVIKRCNNGKTS